MALTTPKSSLHGLDIRKSCLGLTTLKSSYEGLNNPQGLIHGLDNPKVVIKARLCLFPVSYKSCPFSVVIRLFLPTVSFKFIHWNSTCLQAQTATTGHDQT